MSVSSPFLGEAVKLGWDLAERIRDRLRLTQAEFVQRAGLNRSTIQFWKSGTKLPSSRGLKKLATIAPAEFGEELSSEMRAALKREAERQSPHRREAIFPSIPAYLKRAIERASQQNGLDTSYILREVVQVWLRALSRSDAAKRLEKINKEAHKRAQPRS